MPVLLRLTRFGGCAGFLTGLITGLIMAFRPPPTDAPSYIPPPDPMDWWIMFTACLSLWAFVGGCVGIVFGAIGGGVAGLLAERKELAVITPRHQRPI